MIGLVELGVGKVAEVAGRLADLEVIRIGYMLMAIGTVRFLAFDLIFLAKMRLVNKGHLFGEFYFLSLEIIVRFTMAGGGRTTFVYDSGYSSHRAATQLKKGNMVEGLSGYMALLEGWVLGPGHGLYVSFTLRGIMTVGTTDLVMFPRFPGLVGFVHDGGVGQDMTITAKTLRLRDGGCGDFYEWRRALLSPGNDRRQKGKNHKYYKNDQSRVHLSHAMVLLVKIHQGSSSSERQFRDFVESIYMI